MSIFKRLTTLIKAAWLCKVVTKTITGLDAALVAIEQVKKTLEGSEAGEQYKDLLDSASQFIEIALKVLTKATGFICGEIEIKSLNAGDVEGAVKALRRSTEELKNL